MESAYLKKCFGSSLSQALAEVAKARPSDPIEYLAHWLYHYRMVMRVREKERQEKIQLKEEYDRSLREAEMAEMLKQEEYQIQLECGKCHKDQLSTAVSPEKTAAMQGEPKSLEKKASRESLPGVSAVILETLPQNLLSQAGGQTDFIAETPPESNNQEVSLQKDVEETSSSSSSP